MKTIRLICVSVVLLCVNGCIRNISRGSEDVVAAKERKVSEQVVQKGEEGKSAAKETGQITSAPEGDNSGKSDKKAVNFPENSVDKSEPALKNKVTSQVAPPKLVKLGKEPEGKEKIIIQSPPTAQKGVKVNKPGPEKRVERSVSVTIKVQAEKAALPKKIVIEKKGSAASGVNVRKIIIPWKTEKTSSQFIPKVLKVKAGERVLWVNEDARTHFINKKPEISTFSVMIDVGDDDEDEEEEERPKDEGFTNSPLIHMGESWGQVFHKKGTYNYYCFTHPLEMRGTIVVE